jgi:non-ribosomal peptide synthetase component F
MMTGLLGILKAGAAYVPLDPDYPAERLAFMVRDSGIKVVLTNVQPVNAAFAVSEAPVIAIGDILTGPDADADPVAHPAPDDAAYVIYTSGSTGWPKGVEVEHRSIINRLHWMQRRYPIGPGHVILQKTPFTFDVSVWELFSWCLYGASLSFLEPGDERDPERLVEAI